MTRAAGHHAFSLIEVLTVIAIVVILAGLVLGLGKSLKTQADIQLAQSEISIVTAALEQYRDYFGRFPYPKDSVLLADGVDVKTKAVFEYCIRYNLDPNTVTASVDVLPPPGNQIDGYPDAWASTILYYFLHKCPNSSKIIDSLSNTLLTSKVTSKDGSTTALTAKITITIGLQPPEPSFTTDLVRFVDPWGTSLRYVYLEGDVFPEIISAGPDKIFDSPANKSSDDITNR